MYKAIDVWRRLEDGRVTRYRCFEILPDHKYCVQSVDFYNEPLDLNRVQLLDRQYLELLLAEDPDSENATYGTLEEAIMNHDLEFADDEEQIDVQIRKERT